MSTSPSPAQPYLERNLIWTSLRSLFRLICRTWLRVSVSGTENLNLQTGALFLLNHQSYLDPLVAATLLPRPVCFLARDNLFRIPLLGTLLRKNFVIPISREAARTSSIRAALERLDQGFLVGIFPEGTRSDSDELLRFRPGFLALARRTNQPIHPVGIAGTRHALPRKALFIRPARIHIHYGPPLTTEQIQLIHTQPDTELCQLIQQLVADCATTAQHHIRS